MVFSQVAAEIADLLEDQRPQAALARYQQLTKQQQLETAEILKRMHLWQKLDGAAD